MPEYLAPGVFVEEVSYRAKSIEGVSTTTTGFVGPTSYGPIDIEPDIVTSLVEFEQVYGGRSALEFSVAGVSQKVDNYMWNAARAFFEEGGKRLYISRVFTADPALSDGRAVVTDPAPGANVNISARFPGKAGEAKVRIIFQAGPNRYTNEESNAEIKARVRGARNRDIVHLNDPTPGGKTGFWMLLHDATVNKWTFTNGTAAQNFDMQELAAIAGVVEVRTITAAVQVDPVTPELLPFEISGLPLDPEHESDGAKDSLFAYFAKELSNSANARRVPIIIETLSPAEAQQAEAKAQTEFNSKSAQATAANTANTNAQQAATTADTDAATANAASDAAPADAALRTAADDAEKNA